MFFFFIFLFYIICLFLIFWQIFEICLGLQRIFIIMTIIIMIILIFFGIRKRYFNNCRLNAFMCPGNFDIFFNPKKKLIIRFYGTGILLYFCEKNLEILNFIWFLNKLIEYKSLLVIWYRIKFSDIYFILGLGRSRGSVYIYFLLNIFSEIFGIDIRK